MNTKKPSKSQKKALYIKRVKYELALLLPALSFLSEQYALAKEDGASESDDFMILTKTIIKKLAIVTKPYQHMQVEIVDMVNNAITKHPSTNTNFFLIGISLILYHYEINIKILPVALSNQSNMLFDIFSKDGSKDLMNRSTEYAKVLKMDIYSQMMMQFDN